jgi:hypothetical protein
MSDMPEDPFATEPGRSALTEGELLLDQLLQQETFLGLQRALGALEARELRLALLGAVHRDHVRRNEPWV